MPISINGSGTVTGISVGGLPDGIVDTDTLAAKAATAPKLGAGTIVQAKSAHKKDMSSHTGNTFGAFSGLSIDFAKTNAANKLIALIDINGGRDGTIFMQFRLFLDGSDSLGLSNSGGGSFSTFINWYSDNSNGNHGAGDNANINGSAIFDGPNDTNSHTYQIYGSSRDAGRVIYVNRRGAGTSYAGTSCLTLMELQA